MVGKMMIARVSIVKDYGQSREQQRAGFVARASAHDGHTLIARDSATQQNILFVSIVVEKCIDCGCMTRRIGLGLHTICLV